MITGVFENVNIDVEFGYKLSQIFQDAGLGVPELEYFAPTGSGPDWLGYAWLAEGIRTLMPSILQLDLTSEAKLDIETLESRIREEAVRNQSTMMISPHIGASIRVP